jgi:hypothetical protein
VVGLTLAFGALSASEPPIARNHSLSAQALAAAESGLEATLAALSNPQALSTVLPDTIAAALLVRLPGSNAGYRVAATTDPLWNTFERANQRLVTVVGYAGGDGTVPPDVVPQRSTKMLQAIVRRDSMLNTLVVPAALVIPTGGTIKAEIDSRPDGSLGTDSWCVRNGTALPPLTGAAADGSHSISSTGSIWGPGNSTPNEDGVDIIQRGSTPAPRDPLFASQALNSQELAALKALAISTGTFFTGSPAVFNAARPLPAAGTVVYVEGNVQIDPYAATTWSGWLVAVAPAGAGSGGLVEFACAPGCSTAPQSLTINGLIYAEDRVVVSMPTDNRRVTVNGAVISRGLSGAASSINPKTAADFRVTLRCQGDGGANRGVRDAITGTASTTGVFTPAGRAGWYVKPGSYKELSGQS